VDVNQVLDLYADLVSRTLIRGPLPQASIILHTQSMLTKTEAIQALQAVLALNGIAVINIGDKFAKVLPVTDANAAGAPFSEQGRAQLPDLGSYVTHIVQLKYVKPSEMIPIIQPFAKLQQSILAIDGNGILVLRDYAENVKRMLEMIDQIDISVPAEYISEVVPIKYAMAGDIANALGSLGGGGGGTVSIGGSTAAAPISGIGGSRGMGGGLGTGGAGTYPGGVGNQPRGFGTQATTGGAPTPGTTFQQRLQAIMNRTGGGGGAAGQQGEIQLFGQTKIIADERSNSLLIFATRQDMATITNIISKLDVLLSQVLIESAIIDYSLGPNTFNLGISAAQSPKTFSGTPGPPPSSGATAGAGGMNNSAGGAPFLNLFSLLTGGTLSNTTAFGNNLPGGFSYFGNIGPNWDLALTAAAADSHASIIQRPRIQTSQAKPAQFFVGDTVPYITGYGNYGYGNQSTYSQLSVGVELDVTPFINPDGLVVMDIQQEIDDLNGFTTIQNVGDVPNTIKRSLSSEVAVRDKDTIMLGGFIKSNKSTSRSGVPVLMDIPLLGNLFTQRSDKKQREELIVLMRPTVLRTPEIAAAQAIAEEKRLPGVRQVEAEDEAEQREHVEAEDRAARNRARHEGRPSGSYNAPATKNYAPENQNNGFFNAPPPETEPETNNFVPPTP
jgi:general secretion pathway protein D